jgi:hypothetical protein
MAKHTVFYLGHRFDPEDLLNFSELDWFVQNWNDLGLSDEDLSALQILIMLHPRGGDLVPGTGGLRKLRFAPAKWHSGKSGALRVCYVYFEKYAFVVLVTVYAKADLDDLSAAGKQTIRKLLQRIEQALKRRFGF